MKKAVAALFFMTMGLMVLADDKWNDALSSPPSIAAEPIDVLAGPAPVSKQSVSDASVGRDIIIAHLNKIKSSQLMVNTITLEPYWQGVFASAGHPELYASSQADIQVALEAGLSPYLRGQAINAEQFADAAIAALQKTH